MTRLVVAKPAERDLDLILDWLETEAGPPVMSRHADRFRSGLLHLQSFPESGANRSGLLPGLRIWPVAPWIIFYRYSRLQDVVSVIRILDGRRDIAAHLFHTKA